MSQLTRNLFVPLIDTLKGANAAEKTYKWVPIDLSTQFELAYNPNTETKSYICFKNDTSEVTGYAPELPQEIALESDNPLYKFMDKYLNSFPVGSAAQVPFLFVRPDVENPANNKALMWEKATVVGDTLNTVDGMLLFTISLNGDPVEGTVTGLGTENVTFTPDGE